SLDDKIDLLHRQNKTLEALAETLFRQWFVEGNENNNSEKLGDFVDSANTGLDAIKRAPIVEYETGVKCLRIQDISQNKTIDRWGNSEVEENNFKRFQLKRDDIIMARTCSPGINLFIREDLPSVFNNGLVRIRARKDKVHPILLNCLFKTKEFVGHIDGISGGTSVQLNMQVGDLLSYDFSFPPIERQNEIIESFISFDEKTFHNRTQVRTLTRLRDTLLPKLMSGEVRVDQLMEKNV
ncbi:MAG: restriction endonuclease subunit S, partial [Thermodesulfovibrionales bacterium]|nr:restriction endonuclease subunit S [Thermodesulfovibrionales bacterium]